MLHILLNKSKIIKKSCCTIIAIFEYMIKPSWAISYTNSEQMAKKNLVRNTWYMNHLVKEAIEMWLHNFKIDNALKTVKEVFAISK